MAQAQTPQEIEQAHADFLWGQIMADEAGTLSPERRAKLDAASPGWTDPEYREQERISRELARVDTDQDMADFLRAQVEADEAGTLSPYRRAWLDEHAPGWDDPALREQWPAKRRESGERMTGDDEDDSLHL